MEDNEFTVRMRRFYPGREIFEIFHHPSDYKPMCVYVVDYEDQHVINNLVNPQALLIKEETFTILFNYPLKNPVTFKYTNSGGFTRLDLFRCVHEGYKKIYETEENDVGETETYDNLYNRKKSQGTYGIWGHYITDLRIEGIAYDPETKLAELLMGS